MADHGADPITHIQVAVVDQAQADPVGFIKELEDKVELCRHLARVERASPEPFEIQLSLAVVSQNHHGLEEGGATQIAIQVQILKEILERIHLVFEPALYGFSHLTEQL